MAYTLSEIAGVDHDGLERLKDCVHLRGLITRRGDDAAAIVVEGVMNGHALRSMLDHVTVFGVWEEPAGKSRYNKS